MKKLTKREKIQVSIFRNQIEEFELNYLKDLSDLELLDLLNKTVLPNSLSQKTVRNTVFFHFIFAEKKDRAEDMKKSLSYYINYVDNLTKVEKIIIKYAVLIGFKTNNWRKEFFIYLKTPLNLKGDNPGRKIMASYNFKDIFFFAKKLAQKAKENANLPRL